MFWICFFKISCNVISFLFQTDHICILIEEFNPFTFIMIFYMFSLIFTILFLFILFALVPQSFS